MKKVISYLLAVVLVCATLYTVAPQRVRAQVNPWVMLVGAGIVLAAVAGIAYIGEKYEAPRENMMFPPFRAVLWVDSAYVWDVEPTGGVKAKFVAVATNDVYGDEVGHSGPGTNTLLLFATDTHDLPRAAFRIQILPLPPNTNVPGYQLQSPQTIGPEGQPIVWVDLRQAILDALPLQTEGVPLADAEPTTNPAALADIEYLEAQMVLAEAELADWQKQQRKHHARN